MFEEAQWITSRMNGIKKKRQEKSWSWSWSKSRVSNSVGPAKLIMAVKRVWKKRTGINPIEISMWLAYYVPAKTEVAKQESATKKMQTPLSCCILLVNDQVAEDDRREEEHHFTCKPSGNDWRINSRLWWLFLMRYATPSSRQLLLFNISITAPLLSLGSIQFNPKKCKYWQLLITIIQSIPWQQFQENWVFSFQWSTLIWKSIDMNLLRFDLN